MEMASETRPWTIEELGRLPDDGNAYEVVRGELLVTPAPTAEHEEIVARLADILHPFVATHRLGSVYRPRAVIEREGSQTEPDLMVRARHPAPERGWEDAPLPMLVVEVVSDSTRRRDYGSKRAWYLDIGVREYWIVDREARTMTVVRPGEEDAVVRDAWTWSPAGAADGLRIGVDLIFGDR